MDARPQEATEIAGLATPLTVAQREIWREHALFPGTAVHTVGACLDIRGAFDPERLERALRIAWDRHDALRMTPLARDEGAEPVQVAATMPERFLSMHDVAAAPDPAAAAAALADSLGREAIPLAGDPTFRFDLIRVAPDRRLWVMRYHHINMDAWANGLLVRDVAAIYRALAAGAAPDLPAAPAFADAASQADDAARLERDRAYWDDLYRTLPERLVDASGGVLDGAAAAATYTRRTVIDGKMLAGLRENAERLGAPLSRLFIAAALILFHRHSGAADVAFGMPVLGRPTAREKATFGLFSRAVAPRLAIDPDAPVENLLRELDRAMRGAMRHSRHPLSETARRLSQANRRVVQLFDLNVSYERVDYGAIDFGTARAAPPRVLLNGVARTPVELFVRDYGDEDRIEIDLDLSAAAFDADRASMFAARYERVLAWLASGMAGSVGTAPLTDGLERSWLLSGVNATTRDYGAFRPVHRQFEACAAAHPEAPALRFDGRTVSYGELDAQANALARRLMRAGVGPEARVGVLLERSVELVATLLAVMKAGGAYVPLDPDLPRDRLAYMLSDAGVAAVATRQSLLERLPAHAGRTLVVDGPARTGRRGTEAPLVDVGPESLAYVIYTSGSTGRPKGVMNGHGGLANRIAWMQEAFGLRPGERVLQKTPFGFDVSVWEFFWPLTVGGTLVVAPPGAHRDPDALAGLLRDEAIAVCHFVPSMLQAFLGHGPAADALGSCGSLRHVISSGEALPAALANRFAMHAPAGARLDNLYGPTEAAIDVSWHACGPAEREPVPIGHAIANTSLYVLDDALEPVPAGVAGDLWIGGVQVARGYLGRPGLTAESFTADPHGGRPGARMYRTGDVARRRPDGSLEYLGRRDRQVKLRGFRIELGEIETALLEHAGVRTAAVAVREDRPGDRRLVAYVTTGTGVVPPDLEAHLSARLPSHMVPSATVVVDALPVTSNGKLDVAALPAPEAASQPSAALALDGPRTAAEEIACAVFASVLGRSDVGPEENFFALGGHSLLAVQAVGRLRQALDADLPANAVFERPTPRALAELASGGAAAHAPIGRRADDAAALPSFGQRQLWLLSRVEGSQAYNVPDGFIIDGPLDLEALSGALSDVVARHEALRAILPEENGEPVARVLDAQTIAIGVDRLASADAEAVDAWFRRQALRPFDIAREAPIRAAAASLPDGRHALALVMHHTATDGASAPVVYRDLSQAYRARLEGLAYDRAEPAVRYYDWAAWQRADDRAVAMDAALARVRERLAGAPERLDLPEDRRRDETAGFRGRMLRVAMPPGLAEALRARARASAATLFMTLAAGVGAYLARLSGQDEVMLGAPVSGRDRPETQDLVGYMVNAVALRLRAAADDSLQDVIAAARSDALAAFADSDLPFDRVVQALAPARGDGRTPLFRAMLVLQPADRMGLDLAGARTTPVNIDAVSARYDLTFAFDDNGDRLDLVLHYADDLFLPETAERFAHGALAMLRAVADHPEIAVGAAPLLDAEGAVVETRGPDAAEPRPAPAGDIVSRFRTVATAHAQRPAVEDAEGCAVRYAELDRLTDRIAAGLAGLGVGRGDIVGLMMTRGVDQASAMLGVLKAGAAYAPLDPEQPVARLRQMTEIARPALIVTDRGAAAPQLGAETAAFDRIIAADGTPPPPIERVGLDAAYVIFTSGSTGRPKGVIAPDRAVLRLVVDPGYTAFAPGRRVGQIATTAFDAATYEIWGPLLNGGTSVAIAPGAAFAPENLRDALAAGRVEAAFLTTAVFDRAVRSGVDVFAGVDEVLFGGEAAAPDVAALAAAGWPATRFVHVYGPTETTAFASWHDIGADPAPDHAPPIGRPIRATSLYVLDADLNPVPRGVVGALYIGGEGLALGYAGEPGRTAEAFIAGPFNERPGALMYQTGDLARRRPDGAIEFLGRADRQIKLRGFRIEPGEIEGALRACLPNADGVHVGVRPTAAGEAAALHAWVSGVPIDAAIERALRETLRTMLPAWMVPARILPVPVLPITANGKIDAAALPLPDLAPTPAPDAAEDGTATEEALRELWSDLLDGAPVRLSDSFFAVGGHSLLGVRLAAAVRMRFGVDLPLRQIFEKPGLRDMASAIDDLATDAALAAPTIQRRARRGRPALPEAGE